MPYYSQEIIEEVISKSDIVSVVGERVQLKRQGGSYVGLCPFHNDRNPSFSVSPSKQICRCFSCQEGGDVISFVMKYENYTFPEAVKMLADRAGISLPEVKYTPEMKREMGKREKLFEIMDAAEKYFFYQLKTEAGALGMKYFEERKLTPETIQHFGLGYALQYSNDMVRYLKKKGYDDELIREAGLGVFYEKEGMVDKFINRVMFPIQNSNGKVIGFGGRVMGDAKPKYLNSPENLIFEKRKNLFGLNNARKSKKRHMILCEGYMDVIAMHQAGFTEAVASLGTAFTPEQALLLKRFTKDVLLAYDSDGPGVAAALKALAILNDNGMQGRVINMRPYKDPDEFIKGLGVEEFQKRLDHAEDGFMFEVRQAHVPFEIEGAAARERTEFTRILVDMLCRFEDEIERENYLTDVASLYNIDRDTLHKAVMNAVSRGASERTKAALKVRNLGSEESAKRKDNIKDSAKRCEMTLLAWVAQRPELYEQIKDDITAADFTDDIYRKAAGIIFGQITDGKVVPTSVIEQFEEEEEKRMVTEIFFSSPEELEQNPNKESGAERFRNLVIKVKQNGMGSASNMATDPNAELERIIAGKRLVEELSQRKYTV